MMTCIVSSRLLNAICRRATNESDRFVRPFVGRPPQTVACRARLASRLFVPVASHAKVWTNQLTYSFVYCLYLFDNHQNDYMQQESGVATADRSCSIDCRSGGFPRFASLHMVAWVGSVSTTIPTALCSSALLFLLIKPSLAHFAYRTNLFCNLYYSLLIRVQEHHPSLMLIYQQTTRLGRRTDMSGPCSYSYSRGHFSPSWHTSFASLMPSGPESRPKFISTFR